MKKDGGIWATGHDWRWDPADPERNRATCPCGVVTDVERPDPLCTKPRFYIVNGERVAVLPPCPKADENRTAEMIAGTRSV